MKHRKRVRYMHAKGEASRLPSASFDLIASTFVIHECPPDAIWGIVAEAYRLARSNAVVAFSDNNPR